MRSSPGLFDGIPTLVAVFFDVPAYCALPVVIISNKESHEVASLNLCSSSFHGSCEGLRTRFFAANLDCKVLKMEGTLQRVSELLQKGICRGFEVIASVVPSCCYVYG
ncbi:hypothetical protein DITRI_Ditri19aG0188300 [Diplodiscus trichospermus]